MEDLVSYSTSSTHSILDRVAALLSLAPPLAMVSLFTLVLSRRDFATLCLVFSSLFCVALCVILKNIIKDPRPTLSGHSLASDDLYGMPSNHTQLISFLATYLVFWALSGRWMVSFFWRLLLSFSCMLLSILVAWSRIYLGHHSVIQVYVGGFIGSLLGCIHFFVIEFLRKLGIFQHLALYNPFCKFLLLRDCSNIDVITVEYNAVIKANTAIKSR